MVECARVDLKRTELPRAVKCCKYLTKLELAADCLVCGAYFCCVGGDFGIVGH